MKVFISMPMKGKSDEEILATRNRIGSEIKEKYEVNGCHVDIIDSLFGITADALPSDKDVTTIGAYYLGYSIVLLSHADAIYMADGYENNRGCLIEHQIAKAYGIPVLNE